MRDYELVVMVNPSLAEKGQADIRGKIKKWLEDVKGKLVSEDNWGTKKLSYSINKQNEAVYSFYRLKFEPKSLKDFEQKIKLEENIIRHLLIRNDSKTVTQAK